MQPFDSPTSFGMISRLFHWLGAVVIIGLLAVGLYFHEMPAGAERQGWVVMHVSVGALAMIFLLARVGWRFAGRGPDPLPAPRPLQIFSTSVQHLLLLALLILLVTGPLMVWSHGYPINIFGVVSIPSPMAENAGLNGILSQVHKIASRVMMVLIAVHVLGAVKNMISGGAAARKRMVG